MNDQMHGIGRPRGPQTWIAGPPGAPQTGLEAPPPPHRASSPPSPPPRSHSRPPSTRPDPAGLARGDDAGLPLCSSLRSRWAGSRG